MTFFEVLSGIVLITACGGLIYGFWTLFEDVHTIRKLLEKEAHK
jgi:hypothetical protein